MSAADDTPAAAGAAAAPEPRHGLRLVSIWLVLSVAACLVIWFVWYPHLPPGRASDDASSQQFDIAVLSVTAAPVIIGVVLYFIYAVVVWRAKPGDNSDGPAIRGNARIQTAWVVVTTVIVLFLAVFGTVELAIPGGAGSAEGPDPIFRLTGSQTSTWTPGTNDMLQVQVIAQQWAFTYRYPQFGGMESSVLDLPVDTPIEFHVTSLDVIHSFWAYTLGVKADANPGFDDTAYVTPKSTGSFIVRCNELCGIWHGAMYNNGTVLSQTAFQTWATGVQAKEKSNGLLAALPPYALTYDPTVIPQLGKAVVQVDGITGAAGYYYSSGNPVTP